LIQRVEVLDQARESSITRQPPIADAVFSTPKQPLPLFHSPTSSFFCIDIIDTDLKELEVQVRGHLVSPDSSTSPPSTSFSIVQDEIIDGECGEGFGLESEDAFTWSIGTTHPLNELDGEEIIRLVHVYQDTVGFMYPILSTIGLTRNAEILLDAIAIGRDERRAANISQPGIDGNDVAILKMVVAIAVESEGCSDLASNLYQSLRKDVDAIVWDTKVDLKGLVLIALVV
jgi:hypothetical protein